MRILITGGAGLIGHCLIDVLCKSNHKLLILDNLLYQDEYLSPIPFKCVDVSDVSKMKTILEEYNPEVIIHLAGIVGDSACELMPQRAYNTNIKSLEILRDYSGAKVIFPSSCSVYGTNDSYVDELSDLNPLSLYAEMKVKGEQILDDSSLILRLGTMHGMSGRIRNDLVVHALTFKALSIGCMSVFGGNQYRPLLAVKDLVNFIISVVDQDATGIYNIFEDNYKIIDIAKIVKSVIPESTIDVVDMPFEDSRNYRAKNTKIKNDFNFHFGLKPKDTVVDICGLFDDGRVKNFNNIKYNNAVALGSDI